MEANDKKVQEMAQEWLKTVEKKTRDNGQSFYTFESGDVVEMIHGLHDNDVLPQDFIYEQARNFLVAACDEHDLDAILENIVVEEPDYVIKKWYSDFINADHYIDDSIDSGYVNGSLRNSDDLMNILRNAYHQAVYDMYSRCLHHMRTLASAPEETEGEEEKETL